MAITHKKFNPARGQRVLDEVREELKLAVEAVQEWDRFSQQVSSAKGSSLASKFPALDGRTRTASVS